MPSLGSLARRSRLAVAVGVAVAVGCENGVAPVSPPEPEPETPVQLACAAPAPLEGTVDWSDPRFIVTYHDGTDPAAETTRLATRYGFTPRFVYRYALLGFAADLTREAVNGIRCEPTVRRISYDPWVNVLATP